VLWPTIPRTGEGSGFTSLAALAPVVVAAMVRFRRESKSQSLDVGLDSLIPQFFWSSMIQLTSATHRSLLEMEEVIAQIAVSEEADLNVGKEFASKRIGAFYDAARLQLLATWARHSPGRSLAFSGLNTVESVTSAWCDYAPGIVSLRLCQGMWVGDEFVDRRDALEPAFDKMVRTDELNFPQLIKGRTLDFSCISGAKLQYLRPLFRARSPESIKGKQEMFELLTALNAEVSKVDTLKVPDGFLEASSVFMSELLRNTQEHATRDCRGLPYVAHAEGFIISRTQLAGEGHERDFSGNPRLIDFWDREVGSGGGGALRSLQLSFFDTGPGIASRAAAKEVESMSLADEREILLASLKKNESTKKQTGAGNGYPEVLERLRQVGGLMSIRTGRLRVFQAFAPGEDRDIFEFEDWSARLLSPAAGTVVSIILPIRQ